MKAAFPEQGEGRPRIAEKGGSINARAESDVPALKTFAATVRRWIIEQSHRSNVGHIASALSIADLIAVLWGRVMRDPGTNLPDRDRFVLAKGHAALAMYAALRYRKLLDEATFQTFCGDGSAVGVHPESALPGVDLSTGSLGQGLSVACGLAYGFRQKQKPSRVFALLSDAECNEGQVWEAAQFAGHHQLTNLTGCVDANGLQAFGFTRDVLDLAPMAEKWRVFGWDAVEVDGHDHAALVQAFEAPSTGKPRMVVARTIQGKGVSFMENTLEWHYRNLSPAQAAQALADIEKAA